MSILTLIGYSIFAISLVANAILIWFLRKLLKKLFTASESASGIFTHLIAYKENMAGIYELKDFYGEPKLKLLLEHTTSLIEYLKAFEDIYSFTQPELEDILREELDKMEDLEFVKENDTPTEKTG